MKKNYYIAGEHNLICDVCSKKIKSHEGKMRWDGFFVCKEDWEPRHPQDFIRAKVDKITVPMIRPIPNEPFKLLQGIFDLHKYEDPIEISVNFSRSLSDDNILQDSLVISRDISLTDSITYTENFSKNLDYIIVDNNTLTEILAKDILTSVTDTNTLLESFSLEKTVNLTDTNNWTSSGVINLPLYALSDYFAEDYTETTRTFS